MLLAGNPAKGRGNMTRHNYDVRCGCKDCANYELDLRDTIRCETHPVTGQVKQYGKRDSLSGQGQAFGDHRSRIR
jgi:hypothetical protein